jgi:hypothetical protein
LSAKRTTLWVATAAVCLTLLPVPPLRAMMAGAPPDSPAARVDANVGTSPYAGVVAISVGGGTFSGVVIAPQYVLTAGHVAAAGAASSMVVTLHPGANAWTTTVLSATTYPGYSFPYDDLAILQLATPVPTSIPVYVMYGGPLQTGLTLLLAGYGESGNGNVGVSVAPSVTVKRTGANSLDALTDTLDDSGLTSRFFIYDFDGPTGNGSLGGGTLGNSIETMVAVGDSGGPSFIQVGSSLQVLGINTFAASPIANQSPTYVFGEQGGGIVAADPRFASWLQATTRGTMPTAAGEADVPLPPWTYLVLGGALLAMSLARCAHGPDTDSVC